MPSDRIQKTANDLSPVAQPPVALYIHVPFCVSVCPYCDFVVYAGAAARGPRNRIDAFLEALEAELRLRADALDDRWGPPRSEVRPPGSEVRPPGSEVTPPGNALRPALETVYLGGGTPSLLPAAAIAGILDLVRGRFGLASGAEVSLEANPGPDERGDAAALAAAGVTRISFGAQSFDAGELRRLGRRHRPADVAEAVGAARRAGLGSINLDLLYDGPDGSLESWKGSLEAALALGPDHLSLYALTLDDPDAEGLTGPSGDHLPTSPGARRWRVTARAAQDDDRAAGQYRHAVDRLAADGWRGYEISNWARPGHECRHNIMYWQRRPYEAVGPGAHAFDGRVRRWNAANLVGYLAALAPPDGLAARLPPGGAESIDAATAAAESVILGLRMDTGLPIAEATGRPLAAAFEWGIANGLLDAAADRIVLTTHGRLLSNELFARLL